MSSPTAQFGRAYALYVTNTTSALDLSQLRFKFDVRAADVETPNTATIRVYNMSLATAKRIVGQEFTNVILEAGYENNVNYGTIFNGTIKRVNVGREQNVDSYVEIEAADGDFLYNFGFVNSAVGPNSTPMQRAQAAADATDSAIQKNAAQAFANTGGILPRGAVLFGLSRVIMRDISLTANCRWSIQGGVLTFIPLDNYLPGEALILDSQSGLIGTPEVTDNGINMRTLLNAKLKIGGLVNVNQSLINKQMVQSQGFPSYTNLFYPAQTSASGNYRVLVVNHTGDTRGQPWYSEITALDVDLSAVGLNPPVQPY